jgi:hypothetical protein
MAVGSVFPGAALIDEISIPVVDDDYRSEFAGAPAVDAGLAAGALAVLRNAEVRVQCSAKRGPDGQRRGPQNG